MQTFRDTLYNRDGFRKTASLLRPARLSEKLIRVRKSAPQGRQSSRARFYHLAEPTHSFFSRTPYTRLRTARASKTRNEEGLVFRALLRFYDTDDRTSRSTDEDYTPTIFKSDHMRAVKIDRVCERNKLLILAAARLMSSINGQLNCSTLLTLHKRVCYDHLIGRNIFKRRAKKFL